MFVYFSLYMYMEMAEYGEFVIDEENITDKLFWLFDNELEFLF